MPSTLRYVLRPSLVACLGLTLVFGCSHEAADAGVKAEPAAKAEGEAPAPDAEGEAPTPEVEAEDEAPAAEAVTKEISLDPGELSDKGAVLEYCLDCRRKASTYNYCEFDKAAFEAAVAGATGDLNVKVEMVEKASETHVPDDPNAPQPHGGFKHVRHSCKVIEVLPAS